MEITRNVLCTTEKLSIFFILCSEKNEQSTPNFQSNIKIFEIKLSQMMGGGNEYFKMLIHKHA